MKRGLILEGGAMRGMFTAGVTDYFMEQELAFDGIVGVSAGAAFGCNYKSGQIGRALRYNMTYCRDKRYCGWHSLLTTGNIYNAEFCYKEVPSKLDIFDEKAFFENPTEFYAVCTDVETGKALYHKFEQKEEDYFEWFRASASMPLVSTIVEIGGYKLLDGGVADSVPIRFFEGLGYEQNVIVLTQPENYVKKKNELLPLIRRVMKGYPAFVQAVENRHIVYNETLSYIKAQERAGKVFVIRPSLKLPVGRLEKDPQKLKAVYEIGRETAKQQFSALKAYLQK